jgi:hypothetical protein
MRKFMFIAALALAAGMSVTAQAQPPTAQDRWDDAMRRSPDPVRRDEAHIAHSRRQGSISEREAAAAYRSSLAPSFKAGVVVTNSSAKTIKSVDWSATLTDPYTGAVIRTYDVTSKARIAPGRSKKLTKKLQTPRAQVVNAAAPARRRSLPVAQLKVTVTRVTYEDGSTSETP